MPWIDASLAARLMESAQKVFLGLRGNSYARCDFRMDARGNCIFWILF